MLAGFDVFDRDGRYIKRVNLRAEGDAAEDGIYFVGGRVYVVTELLSARMADLGAGDDEESNSDDDEPEPMSLIAYDLDKVGIAVK